MKKMWSVNEVRDLIFDLKFQTKSETVLLKNAYGKILAKDVVAPIDLPPFDQSAMDGYAVRFDDIKHRNLPIAGEVAAGQITFVPLEKQETLRIFTGANVPDGADTVIIQEDVRVENGSIHFEPGSIQQGQHIRRKGTQIARNQIALKQGSKITAGAMGYLAAMGIEEIQIVTDPRISVIVTGNELKEAGTQLEIGQIYESNSIALIGALKSIGIEKVVVMRVEDKLEIIRSCIDNAIQHSELVLITGGVSVGDYDFTGKALEELGVQRIFYKVAQRPGKPLYCGQKNNTIVFGLPGNPASVLSCFYEYVISCIRCMRCEPVPIGLPKVKLKLADAVRRKSGLTLFLKGKMEYDQVRVLKGQESHILSSFAEADCLIVLPDGEGEVQAGTEVECHILPF